MAPPATPYSRRMMLDPGLQAPVMEPGPTAEWGRARWGLLGCSGRGRGGQPPEGEADGPGPVPARFAALEGWLMQKSDGALRAVGV